MQVHRTVLSSSTLSSAIIYSPLSVLCCAVLHDQAMRGLTALYFILYTEYDQTRWRLTALYFIHTLYYILNTTRRWFS